MPRFQNGWTDEFLKETFETTSLRIFCILIGTICVFDLLTPPDGTGGDFEWVILTKLPALAAIIIFILVIASTIPIPTSNLRQHVMKNYDMVCSLAIAAALVYSVCPKVILEIRRSRFQSLLQNTTRWQIDYSGKFPSRSCNDSNPVVSWSNPSVLISSTCANLLLDGGLIGKVMLNSIFPLLLHLKAKSALFVACFNLLLLLVAFVVVGTSPELFVPTVLLTFISGLFTTYFCHLAQLNAREKFVIEKGLRFASEENSHLLHTLIPEEMLAKIRAGHTLTEAKEIQHVTIIFFTLARHEELLESFSEAEFLLLNAVFNDFDTAVQERGMFKYQHVGECPKPIPSLVLERC